MTRDEITAKAFKQLTQPGWLIFVEALRRGRLEPTKGVSGAVCRLWIDWLQADGAVFGLSGGDLIRWHLHRTLDTDESFEVYENVSELTRMAAARYVDNETAKEARLTEDQLDWFYDA
jgi:hypothetical protein